MGGLLLRRRAMMQIDKVEEPNGLAPASSVCLNGTSTAYVSSDGMLHIDTWNGGSTNRLDCYFKRPFEVAENDNITIKIVRKSGSMSTGTFVDVRLNWQSQYGFTNKYWGAGATPFNQSFTMSSAATISYIGLSNRSGSATFSNYSVEIQITVNGTRVI